MWGNNGEKRRDEKRPARSRRPHRTGPGALLSILSTHEHFVLYADAHILSRPDLLTIIYEKFGLTAGGTRETQPKRDSHYVHEPVSGISPAFPGGRRPISICGISYNRVANWYLCARRRQ
jgi:hypothetical protein